MGQGRASPKAWETLDQMRGIIEGLNPTAGAQLSRYEQVLEQLHGLDDARRERLLAASEGLATILWVVLILGGIITVGFTYLFGLENTLVHTLMVASLAMLISDAHLLDALHRGRPRLPVQGRHTHPPDRLRAGAREVPREQAQRPLRS
jgi:hypothetical protein